MLLEQTQTLFFNFDGSMPHLPPTPTDEEIRTMLAHNNQSCPLNEIIVGEANSGNLRNLRRFAFSAYRRANRSCRGCNFGIYSPPGQGKTFVVKKFAETIGIPFVFIQSPALEDSHMLFQQISEALGLHLSILMREMKKKMEKIVTFIYRLVLYFLMKRMSLRTN